MMKKRWIVMVVLGMTCVMGGGITPAQAADDDGSTVRILVPQNGATVDGASVELKYELAKGAKAHHAHVYLDGQYQKGFKGTFINLPAGTHDIRVMAATDDHKGLAAEATITITVK